MIKFIRILLIVINFVENDLEIAYEIQNIL